MRPSQCRVMRPSRAACASFPCSFIAVIADFRDAAPRAEKFSGLLNFAAGELSALFKALWLPHLKLITKADKRDCGIDPCMRPKDFRKHDAAVAIDREHLDVAVECDRELIALIRIVWQAREKPVDLFRKSFAACIERWSIERGVAVDAASVAVALKDGAERGWDGDPAFGVDFVCECRDKAVHPFSAIVALHSTEPTRRLAPGHCAEGAPTAQIGAAAVAQSGPSLQTGASPRSLPDAVGLIWNTMGFHGRQWIVKDFVQFAAVMHRGRLRLVALDTAPPCARLPFAGRWKNCEGARAAGAAIHEFKWAALPPPAPVLSAAAGRLWLRDAVAFWTGHDPQAKRLVCSQLGPATPQFPALQRQLPHAGRTVERNRSRATIIARSNARTPSAATSGASGSSLA